MIQSWRFRLGESAPLYRAGGPDSRVHERQPVTDRQENLPPAAISRAARWVIVALALYAVATPLLVVALVALKLVPVPSPDFIMIGLGLALFGPGLAVITMALRGLNAVVRDLTIRPDTEPQQAIIRLFIAGAVLAYLDWPRLSRQRRRDDPAAACRRCAGLAHRLAAARPSDGRSRAVAGAARRGDDQRHRADLGLLACRRALRRAVVLDLSLGDPRLRLPLRRRDARGLRRCSPPPASPPSS